MLAQVIEGREQHGIYRCQSHKVDTTLDSSISTER